MANGHGGRRNGAGRPKSAKKHFVQTSLVEGLIWYHAPLVILAMIRTALNGDPGLLKYLGDRLFGRLEDYVPILRRTEAVEAALPEDWDPEAMIAELAEQLTGTPPEGPWTTADAAQAGRLGLEGLRQRAQRGDGQAQALLARSWIGDPILSLGEQAATMTPEQLRATMLRRYAEAWPWLSPVELIKMVDALQQSPASTGEGDKT